MKKFIVVIMFAVLSTIIFAQGNADTTDKRPLNNIYLNFLGDFSNVTINYERVFFIKSIFFLTAKIGIGFTKELEFSILGNPPPSKRYLTTPLHITANLGQGKHFFEFGIGGTLVSGNFERMEKHFISYPIIGYRLQPLNYRKANFRIFFTWPFSGMDELHGVWISPFGFSIGVSF